MLSCALRKTFGYRPVLPWIPYSAISRLNSIISHEYVMLEFGSGMSTIWYAQRCRTLVSIEHDPDWYNAVNSLIKRYRLKNVDYRLRSEYNYEDLSDINDNRFDLVVIDGIKRPECAHTSIIKVKHGSYI